MLSYFRNASWTKLGGGGGGAENMQVVAGHLVDTGISVNQLFDCTFFVP